MKVLFLTLLLGLVCSCEGSPAEPHLSKVPIMREVLLVCVYVFLRGFCYVDSYMLCEVVPVVSDSLWPHGLYSPPGSSVHGVPQARILEWVAISSSMGSSRPRDQAQLSHIAGRFFTVWATRKAQSLLSVKCLLGIFTTVAKQEGELKVLVIQLCLTHCNPIDYRTRLFCPWDSPLKDTAVGCHFLFQGIFLTLVSNLCLPHCR